MFFFLLFYQLFLFNYYDLTIVFIKKKKNKTNNKFENNEKANLFVPEGHYFRYFYGSNKSFRK